MTELTARSKAIDEAVDILMESLNAGVLRQISTVPLIDLAHPNYNFKQALKNGLGLWTSDIETVNPTVILEALWNRLKADAKKAWPKSIDEAVNKLLLELDDKSIDIIKACTKDDLYKYHHTLGQSIRNEFGLWQDNKALLSDTGGTHPDDASHVIIQNLWSHLQGGGGEEKPKNTIPSAELVSCLPWQAGAPDTTHTIFSSDLKIILQMNTELPNWENNRDLILTAVNFLPQLYKLMQILPDGLTISESSINSFFQEYAIERVGVVRGVDVADKETKTKSVTVNIKKQEKK